MGLNTQTENKFIGARNAGFSFPCFTAQRLLVINSFMMFVQHRHPACFTSTFLLGDGRLLSLLAQNWISQKIKQKDRSVFHAWALQGGKSGSRNYVSMFPWDTTVSCAGEEMGLSLLALMLEKGNSQVVSEENLGQQSLGPVTRALPLLPRCHTTLGTAPPVLESTVASTVGEISELENHHLAFPANTEHLKRILTATVQKPQTIPRAACLESFPTPRHSLPNSILSHTRIKPEQPMSLTELFLICTSTSENKFGGQVSSITDWRCGEYLTVHLKNRKCSGSRDSLHFTGL